MSATSADETNRPAVLLLDSEDTLALTSTLRARAAGQLWGQFFGLASHRMEHAYQAYAHLPQRECFEAMSLSSMGCGLSDQEAYFLREALSQMVLHDLSRAPLFPESINFLNECRARGLILIWSSAHPEEETKALIKTWGVFGAFDAVWGSDPSFRKLHEHFPEAEYQFKTKNLHWLGRCQRCRRYLMNIQPSVLESAGIPALPAMRLYT